MTTDAQEFYIRGVSARPDVDQVSAFPTVEDASAECPYLVVATYGREVSQVPVVVEPSGEARPCTLDELCHVGRCGTGL